MTIAVTLFAGVFALLAAALVFTWWRGRQTGALLLAATYLIAAVLALMAHHWWPLVIGFLSAWALRLMGLEPDHQPAADKDARPPD